MWLLLLGACDLGALKDKVEGLTNPLVTEGLVLGIEPPDADIDISASGYEPGVQMTAFLADAASVTEIQNAPVDGAHVEGGPSGDAVVFEGQGEGSYTGRTSSAYTAGATYTIAAQVDGDTSTADIVAPPGPDLDTPDFQGAGQPMTVMLAGKGYTGALVIVLDPATQAITYSNRPASIKDVYDLGHSDTEIESVTIPAAGFPASGPYVLGVAGLVHTNADDIDGMNTALSSVLCGEMQFNGIIAQ
jgi:hypothetical protein